MGFYNWGVSECGVVAMQYPEDKKWGLICPASPAHKLVLDILRITRRHHVLCKAVYYTCKSIFKDESFVKGLPGECGIQN